MSHETLDHTPRWRRATFAGTLQHLPEKGRRIVLEVRHYYAIAEPADTGFRITFLGRPGITSVAMTTRDIVAQAQRALALMLPANLPRSIEHGAKPPTNLSDYVDPLVVVIPFRNDGPGLQPGRR